MLGVKLVENFYLGRIMAVMLMDYSLVCLLIVDYYIYLRGKKRKTLISNFTFYSTKTTSYGTWLSSVNSSLIVENILTLLEIQIDEKGNIYWLEHCSCENGRYVIHSNKQQDGLISKSFNCRRTCVHEYSSGPYYAENDMIYFTNFLDQCIYRFDLKHNDLAISFTNELENSSLRLVSGEYLIQEKNVHKNHLTSDECSVDGYTTLFAFTIDYENQRSPECSHSHSRSPIHLSSSNNNQKLSTQRDYNQLTSRNNNEHNFHDKRNNYYRSSYSNPNNTNYNQNIADVQINQTINLYSDQELELKYRWEKTVHVSNIPYDMESTALKDLFLTKVSQVMYIEIFKRDGKSLGCGSIEFRTVEEAKHAVEKMHQFEYDDRKLTVILDEEGYQTRRAKYQTLEGCLLQKNNLLHHHCNLSNQFDHTSENINSISLSSQITDLNSIGTSFSNYSSLTDIPSHVLQRLVIEEPITNKIFIENLDFQCNEEKIHELFSSVGCIRDVTLKQTKEGQNDGIAVIEYKHSLEAVRAILKFNQQQLYDRIMTVKIVLNDEEKDDGKLIKLPSCLKSIGTDLSIAVNPLGTTSKRKTMIKIEVRILLILDVTQLESSIPQINPINSNSMHNITSNKSISINHNDLIALQTLSQLSDWTISMNEVQRKLSFDGLFEEKTIKFLNEFDQSMTCFENLSNELLCEIFDYLDGYQLFQAFSNLNSRFEQLIHSSCVLIKTRFCINQSYKVLNTFEQFIFSNRHQ
ncbi:unnamed protein product, partial [Rotaria sp. Silwood2]